MPRMNTDKDREKDYATDERATWLKEKINETIYLNAFNTAANNVAGLC